MTERESPVIAVKKLSNRITGGEKEESGMGTWTHPALRAEAANRYPQ